jgi:predicted transcriptional regulator
VNKGHLRYRKEGRKYVYTCTISEADTGAAATKQLLSTFFKGSVPRAISALLDVSREELTNDDLDRLVALIEEMRSDAH